MHYLNLLLSVIPENWKVLEVGAALSPFEKSTHGVDILPYDKVYWANGAGARSKQLTEDNWKQIDITKDAKWDFEDDEFDLVICSHTLEDLPRVDIALREMNRVGQRFYFETPSRFTDVCINRVDGGFGYQHHHWFMDLKDDTIIFTKKINELLTPERTFDPPGFFHTTVNHKWVSTGIFANKGFKYEVVEDEAQVIKFCDETIELAKEIPDLFSPPGGRTPKTVDFDPWDKFTIVKAVDL